MHSETCSCACRGGMIFTFYKARGMSVGSSLVEKDKLDLAKNLEEAAKAKGVEFILPTDVVIADKFDENAKTNVVSADAIPDGWMVRLVPLPALRPERNRPSMAWSTFAPHMLTRLTTPNPKNGQTQGCLC